MMFRFAIAAALLAAPTFTHAQSVGDKFENPLDIATAAFVWSPPDGERRPDVEVRTNLDFHGQLTILISKTGYASDCVGGRRHQYVLNEIDGLWEVTFTRTQVMCRRGSNTITWREGRCS